LLGGLAIVFAAAGACARAGAPPAPIAGAAAAAAAAAAPAMRLPADVRPTAYRLDLDANPESDRFSGTVTIQLTLRQAQDVIWLHGQGLSVSEAKVKAKPGGADVSGTFAQVTPDGLAKVVLARPIGPGEATLTLTFSTPFDVRNEGFYKVRDGSESYAMTQFEALSARLAFPCFDEPSFKAPITLTLTAPERLVAVANTAVEREEALPGGRKRWHFQTTTPLPTYLYAWAVGPWEIVVAPAIPPHGPRTRALPLRGLATKGHGAELAQSLALAPTLVKGLEDYFGLAYPFDKLDLLAAPDFQAGAMENAGLITFRDNLLLVDEHRAPLVLRKYWVRVMAHELAHQWFGDLVTMSWWDDIWLNEAFAEWLCYPIAAQARPQYNFPLQLGEGVESAMGLDALVAARRIRQTIGNSGDVRNAFDAVTYQKGAALIGMFERYLGHEVFRKGIHDYLVAHAQGNASVDDLLAALSRASGKDVTTAFRTFLDQPGVPLIEADLRCAGGKATLGLKQSRFLEVGSKVDTHIIWQLPLCARYGDGKSLATACTLLTTRQGSLDLPGKGCPAVVLPNAGGEGYFRWSLPAPQLRKLLRAPGLIDRERLSLAQTVFAGYRAAVIHADDALVALSSLVGDREPAVSARFIDLLEDAKQHLVEPADRPAVMKKTAEVYRPVLARVGLKPRSLDEDVRITERRAQAARALVMVAENPATRKELAALGRAYLGAEAGGDGRAHPEALELSLGRLALTAALETDPSLFAPWVERLVTERNPLVRIHLIAALSADRDPAHAARMRALAIEAELPPPAQPPHLRVSERLVPLGRQMDDYRTRPAAWAWLQLEIDALAAGIATEDRATLPLVADSFCSDEEANQVEALFRPRFARLDGAQRTLAQTVEMIQLCAALVAAQRSSAQQFFAPRSAGKGKPAPGAR
jgi:cytosol alanyl aminopeptidase